jgi:serpin B
MVGNSRRSIALVLGLIAAFGAASWAGGEAMDIQALKVVEGNNRFALDLYGHLRGQPGNLFFSPNSISTALAMTYAGARGETEAQMARTLHFGGDPEAVHQDFRGLIEALRPGEGKAPYRLSVANRLWGQQGYHFLPDFLAITRESYHAELASVDFSGDTEAARDRINRWVAQQTEDKIRDLVPPGVLTPLTRLVLTNAIYFKGDWSRPFAKQATKDEDFNVSGDKTTRVPMMRKQDDFRLGEGDGLKVLELPYGGGDLAALFVLPDAIDGLSAVEGGLSPETLQRWRASLSRQKVDVFLPRFKLTSTFSLAEALAAMGMPLAFDFNRADFSGISTQEKLYISAVLHKAYVDVNEKGTEAAAATAVAIAARAVQRPRPPAVFRADHPFLFLIVDNRTQSILFMGRVVNPS